MSDAVRVEAEFVGGPEDGKRLVVRANTQGVPRSSVIEVPKGIPNPDFAEDAPWEPPFLGVVSHRYVCGDDVQVSADGLVWYFTLEAGVVDRPRAGKEKQQ
jgi:hypothetical protein